MTVAEQQQRLIDGLLQSYLGLLDDYTALRRQLCHLQAGIYQHIARANFTAERCLRYGTDHYDGRMRAARWLSIFRGEAGVGVYGVGLAPADEAVCAAADAGAGAAGAPGGGLEAKPDETARRSRRPRAQRPQPADAPAAAHHAPQPPAVVDRQAQPTACANPLRWFGLFAPAPLRAAQELSVEVVERVLPRLLSVRAEMLHVEREVRRARKLRAKQDLLHGGDKPSLTG